MDSLELMRSGCWHNGFTNEIFEALIRAEELCFQYNSLSPRQRDSRHDIMRGLIGKIEEPLRHPQSVSLRFWNKYHHRPEFCRQL